MVYRDSGQTQTFGNRLGATGRPNAWVRLKRVGSVYYAYSSINGTEWEYIGSHNFGSAMSGAVQFGLAVIAHDSSNAGNAAVVNFSSLGSTGSAGILLYGTSSANEWKI